jgi:hypothetical protein
VQTCVIALIRQKFSKMFNNTNNSYELSGFKGSALHYIKHCTQKYSTSDILLGKFSYGGDIDGENI